VTPRFDYFGIVVSDMARSVASYVVDLYAPLGN
jgi:hypothetical protein